VALVQYTFTHKQYTEQHNYIGSAHCLITVFAQQSENDVSTTGPLRSQIQTKRTYSRLGTFEKLIVISGCLKVCQ